MQIYSIRDQKGECFSSPFYKHTHGEAERDFHTLVKDPASTLNKYPTDFDLYHLGTIDLNTGKITTPDTPFHVVKAVQFTN